jgi:hypothetical protein
MLETPDEYRLLVEQKMLARSERHVRENQAQQDEQAAEARAAVVAQARIERAQRLHVVEMRQQEEVAEARRNRPTLIAQFRADPTGLRKAVTLREVCLHCGSEQVRCQSDNLPRVLVCPDCATRWIANACWSCATGLLDTRDPETPRCRQCGWPKCAECGACNPQGCSTNPYNSSHRQQDEILVVAPLAEDTAQIQSETVDIAALPAQDVAQGQPEEGAVAVDPANSAAQLQPDEAVDSPTPGDQPDQPAQAESDEDNIAASLAEDAARL